MKKSLVGAIAALALVFGGASTPALAVGSNAGSFNAENYNESGTLLSPSVGVGANARQVSIYAELVPSASAWAAIQNGTRVFVAGSAITKDGVAFVSGSNGGSDFSTQVRDSAGTYLNGTYGQNGARSYTISPSGSVGLATITVSAFVYSGGPYGNGSIAAGTYAFTPTLTIDGVAANLSDYTVSYRYSISYTDSFTAQPSADSISKFGSVCVDTAGFSVGDQLTVTIYNNGVAGFSGFNDSMSSQLAEAIAPSNGPPIGGSSVLASLSGNNTGVYTYTLTANEVNSLLIVDADVWADPNQSGPETFDASVTRAGAEVTVPCFPGTLVAPTVTNSGSTTSFAVPAVGIAAYASLYDVRCYGDPLVWGPGSMPLMGSPVNGVCSFNNTSASSNYNFYYRVSLQGNGVYAGGVMSAVAQSSGAVGSAQPQVQNPAPAIVFNQPKFEIPAKIAISASGKVSLTGKDMGVTSVTVGGKDQKIDVNSSTKLDFDTTGLSAGVHDLVMKGAFGTYTVQKAIQVGTPVETKVYGLSARTVNMAGGELSINGVGLEGATQVAMNGQILEIVSKTDTKVTFKVPASTLATKNNSILIAGSFLPVLFKNAFTYTN